MAGGQGVALAAADRHHPEADAAGRRTADPRADRAPPRRLRDPPDLHLGRLPRRGHRGPFRRWLVSSAAESTTSARRRPLGTGGALGILPAPPTEAVLVMNGDLVTSADIGGSARLPRSGRVCRDDRRPALPPLGPVRLRRAVGRSRRRPDREADHRARGQQRDLRGRAAIVGLVEPRASRSRCPSSSRRSSTAAARSERSRSRTTGSTSASATSSTRRAAAG